MLILFTDLYRFFFTYKFVFQILNLITLVILKFYLLIIAICYKFVPQVQWNLLSGTSLLSDEGGAARIYCPWNKIEDNYRKLMPLDEVSIRPRFYSLTYGEYNNQEPPKLDGLVIFWSTVLSIKHIFIIFSKLLIFIIYLCFIIENYDK